MKIEDAETTSIKNGKKVVGRMEERIRELVGQVDDEARRMAEAVKNLKKTERGVKECNYRAGEDSKNSERIKVGGNSIPLSYKVLLCSGPDRQAAAPGQDVQEAAGGGGGHRCQQPGQVQGRPEGVGGGPGESRGVRAGPGEEERSLQGELSGQGLLTSHSSLQSVSSA